MLGIIAIILLVLWAAGLGLHLFGGFIHLLLVVAVILAIAHFVTGRKVTNL